LEIIPDLEKVNGAGKHLLNLITDVLDLSKIEAGKMRVHLETFSIRVMMQEVANTVYPLVERNGNHLTIEAAEEIGEMRADPVKTRQILLNLLSNAAKFTEQGSILLRVFRERVANRYWIVFCVEDTGIGLSPDQQEKLFKDFSQVDASTTRKYEGTGLGLSISHHFCRMMGGRLSLVSQLGQGSAFTVRLPDIDRPDLTQSSFEMFKPVELVRPAGEKNLTSMGEMQS
jgi:signal transduction histidine kinase